MNEPKRVEFTILDPKLDSKVFLFGQDPVPHCLYSTRYEDAIAVPFPYEGKRGLSIFVGREEHFAQAEVPLLWALEKKRGRARLAVVSHLRGKDFWPTFQTLENSLTDGTLAPLNFLRRRKKKWDSLDFFSAGDSASMEGAAPRLKRLKQRGWETLIDKLTLVDGGIKKLYFEELDVERDTLRESAFSALADTRLSGFVGIAGQGLKSEYLPLLAQQDSISSLSARLRPSLEPQADQSWTYLSKGEDGNELLFLGRGEMWLQTGQALSASHAGERDCEFQVAEALGRVQRTFGTEVYTLMKVRVDWRYKPAREIPVNWRQNSVSPAGSEVPHG